MQDDKLDLLKNIGSVLPVGYTIKYIPEGTREPQFVKKTMNRLIKEHPEYECPCYALAVTPVEIWAENVRKKWMMNPFYNKGIDTAELKKAYEGILFYVVYGIEHLKPKEKAAIEYVHFGGAEISYNTMAKYYPEALLNLCENIVEPVFESFLDIAEIYNDYCNEDVCILHDDNMLMELGKLERRFRSGKSSVLETLKGFAIMLKDYPVDDQEISYCMYNYFNGMSISQIAKEMGKSCGYVKDRLFEGRKFISVLIWGFSQKDSPIMELMPY